MAETPSFANPTLRRLATGWRLSGIYRYSTGSYLTVTAGSDRALNGTATNGQRAVQVLENPFGDDRSGDPRSRYINGAAFAQPALGTLSTLGTSNIEGPGTWTFDLALSRTFRLFEAHRLEVRAEAFNVPNSFRPENPVTNLNSPRFGLLDRALDPRILQFALKYAF
ncbi:MAG: hypothetical protein HYU27_07870 [Acidobacteria bacterium]|nr:hypothetical protein [Acidobacteriota bacterium]